MLNNIYIIHSIESNVKKNVLRDTDNIQGLYNLQELQHEYLFYIQSH